MPGADARTTNVASTDGVTVAVHDFGGSGEPLLLCHATGFHGRAYTSLAGALRRHHHVFALDVRAHGASTPPTTDAGFTWSGVGDDVLAAVDAIGATSLHAFGHSMGGAAVLLAEVRRPGLVRSAYLFEPIVRPPGPPSSSGNVMADTARRRREVFAGKPEALWHFARNTPLGDLEARSLAAYVEHGFDDQPDGTARLACRAEHEARTFEGGGSVSTDDIAAVACSTVVAVGLAESEYPAVVMAPAVVAALPHARLVTYAHLGHLGPLQDPDTVADDVLALTGHP